MQTNILYEQFSKIVKCLIITLHHFSLKKQQDESEISEVSVRRNSLRKYSM